MAGLPKIGATSRIRTDTKSLEGSHATIEHHSREICLKPRLGVEPEPLY